MSATFIKYLLLHKIAHSYHALLETVFTSKNHLLP